MSTYRELREIGRRPACFAEYTAAELWTDAHVSAKMLAFHLDGTVDVSSRRTEFLDRSAAWIVARFGLGDGKAVADFGCGPGLYTTRLAAAGAAVTGIDFSARSIAYARESAVRQGLAIEHIQADYLKFESERRFDLITMIMCDYCALSPGQRRQMLARFRRHLNEGGAVLLDVYSLSALAAREESASYTASAGDSFWSAEPNYCFQNTFKYETERVVVDKFTIVEEARTRTIYNWLQHFDCETLRAEIESEGLAVEEFLGDVAGGAYEAGGMEFAVVARRG